MSMWWDKRQEYYYDPYGGNEDLHKDGCLTAFVWIVLAGIICYIIGVLTDKGIMP